MKKIFVGSLISSCLAMWECYACSEVSAFDGVSVFAGLVCSNEKVENNETMDVGFVNEQKIWNDWNAALYGENIIGAWGLDDGYKQVYKARFGKVTEALRAVKSGFSEVLYALNGDGTFSNDVAFSDKTHVVATSAQIAQGVRVRQSKNLKGFGGMLGAAYRFAPAGLDDAVFGVSFEMNVGKRSKKNENFGKFGVLATKTDLRYFCQAIGDENEYKAALKLISGGGSAVTNGMTKEIPVVSDASIVSFASISYEQGIFYQQNTFSTEAIKKNTGSNSINSVILVENDVGLDGCGTKTVDEYKNLLLVYNDGTSNFNREVKRAMVQPFLDFTVGYKFGECKLLAEGFVGVTQVNTKVSYWNSSNSQLVKKVKVNKISPSVGVNFGYAVSENVYAGVKARYIFNTKKGTEKIKNNYQVSLYLALNPKNTIAD